VARTEFDRNKFVSFPVRRIINYFEVNTFVSNDICRSIGPTECNVLIDVN
jgi:hypothetical protein